MPSTAQMRAQGASRTEPATGRRKLRLARMLKQLREGRGLTFDALEAAAGVSRTYLWGLEKGRFENPSTKICTKLASFYEIPVSTLLDDSDEASERNGIVTWETISSKAKTLSQSQLRVVDAVVEGLRGARPV